MKKALPIFFAILLFPVFTFAQIPAPTPPDEKPEIVTTEEIKINIAAFDEMGKSVNSLTKDDLVISENNVLHQANSVRKLPASVLIVLDMGGEERLAKDIKTTRDTAKNLVSQLNKHDSIALIQYSDKAETLCDWTTDRQKINTDLLKNLKFGKRSAFIEALNFSAEMLGKAIFDNRHIVLITDGIDSFAGAPEKKEAMKNLLSTTANIHIFSYTEMEKAMVKERKASLTRPSGRRTTLPPGAVPQLPNSNNFPSVTINLDREMMKKIKQRGEALDASQKELTQLSEDANGLIFLPETKIEMIEKTALLAQNIDSQYVVTYTPKRALSEVKKEEMRVIEVTSRRSGLIIQARRKLIVKPEN